MTKRILITGKNSYIGQSFTKYVEENEINFKVDSISVRGDEWKDTDFSKYDVVLHCAGIAHANAKENQRDIYYRVNTDLTLEVAKQAKEQGVKQFIFMSSAIVYTSSQMENGKITKDTIPFSKDPYGDSKIKAEEGLGLLADPLFKVAIIRPPMIYGKGSKGNYPKLSKLAQISPVFPDYKNRRSMLHIDNLSMFLFLVIKNKESGIFWPQNSEYTETSEMVAIISEVHNKKIVKTKFFNLFIKLGQGVSILNKLFGDLYYDQNISKYEKGNYQIYDLKASIIRTECDYK